MISNINLRQFRSYLNQSFEFDPGVNIIVGPNGSGKTNLLEAIHLISINKTFRPVSLRDLIMTNRTSLKIASLDNNDLNRNLTITSDQDTTTKDYQVNEVKYKRLPLEKTIPVVLFEPSNLSVFSGSPERRRKYFDDLIEKVSPGFDSIRNKYLRTLTQRNNLLKKQNLSQDELFAWNIKLSELASQIIEKRHQLVDDLNKTINGIYNQISANKPKYEIEIKYLSKWDKQQYSSKMLKHLQENSHIERIVGHTQVGPHKEDMKVYLNQKDSVLIASRGENRTLLLALKIQELSYIEEMRQQKPILLLDDVFSELDGKRRKHLTNLIESHQTFITTTDADLVINNFNSSNIIPIRAN